MKRDFIQIYPCSKRKGFTLVEITIVMVVLMLLLTMTLPSFLSFMDHEELRDASRTLRIYAKTAQRQAIYTKKQHEVELGKNRIAVFSVEDSEKPILEYEWDEDIRAELRFWLEKKWYRFKGQRWTFDSTGLCQPISVSFRKDSSYVELTFDPLTANVAEENFYFE